jgi:LuxR family transcriptional regulator, maltose regulon positive regulatory protein
VDLRILGPLEVRHGGAIVPLRRARQRILMTALIIRRGEFVSPDALAELLWGDDQPANAANALQGQISHLRRALEPLASDGRSIVVTGAGGYRLDVPGEAVDASRFEKLVSSARALAASGRSADLARSTEQLTSALELWSGEPLADLSGHPFGVAEAARLSGLRLIALEARADALLALGRHRELVPELQGLVATSPLHERFHAQLIVALYRGGRQVDALRAFAVARTVLAEEVGLDPGRELALLEHQVLARAPELEWSPPADAPSAAVAPPPPQPESSPRRLARPPPGRHHLTRPRLDTQLEHVVDASLVLVSAPAGSGKSAALSGWLDRRQGGGGWVPLEPTSNDPSVFWPTIAAALGLPDPGNQRDVRSLLDQLSRATAEPIVLVLDDYHVITNDEIHAGIDTLVAAPGSGLQLVVATRHDPPLRLAALRASGRLGEIRFDHLRFERDELSELVNGVMDLGVAPDGVDLLLSRTEGWAVGVQLAALSLQHHPRRAEFLLDFAGDDRHIADYLRDEVLARLDGDLRRFLLVTSILDRFCAPLCEAVTGEAGAQEHLDELERRNLFLIPLDHRRAWYRYHSLFAEWLRLQPMEGSTEERHRRAGEWLADHDAAGEAIHHLLVAGEPEAAADVIERERWMLVGQGRQRTLHEWTRSLPSAVLRSRPQLTMAAAWVAYDAGHWSDVDHLVRLLRPEDIDGQPDAELLRAERALLTAGRLVALGQLGEAGAIALDALATIPEHEPRGRTGLLLVLGKSRLAAGDLGGARRAFLDAERLAHPYRLTIVEVIASCHLAELARIDGRTHEAERVSREALGLAERAGLADHAECAIAHLTLGQLLLDAGDVAAAATEIERGSELARRIPYEPRARAADAAITRLAETRTTPGRRDTAATAEPLTGKELAVLRLLPTSLTPREIAAELYVSLNTVKSHTRSLYRKLGVQTRHAAVEQARRADLL